MKSWPLLAATWFALALSTLLLVIEHEDSLASALVAWAGGVITYRLVELTVQWWKRRNDI